MRNRSYNSLSEARLILDTFLDLEQNRRLPIIELGNLVELEYSTSECVDVSSINSVDDGIGEFEFTRGGEGVILRNVLLGSSPGSDDILIPTDQVGSIARRSEATYLHRDRTEQGFQPVLLHAVLR